MQILFGNWVSRETIFGLLFHMRGMSLLTDYGMQVAC